MNNMLKHLPKVSICIPAYNRSKYLRKSLDMIFLQTYKNFEVIITDDSITDDVAKFINLYDDDRLKYLRNAQRLGTPENWNESLRRATGDFIKIIHDDDYLYDENSLQNFVDMLVNNPSATMAFSSSQVVNSEGEKIRVHRLTASQELYMRENPIKLVFAKNLIGAPSATIFRNEGSKIFFDPNIKRVVDLDFYITILSMNNKVVYSESPLICIRQHSNQVTQTYDSPYIRLYEWRYYFKKNIRIGFRYHGFNAKCINLLGQFYYNYYDNKEYFLNAGKDVLKISPLMWFFLVRRKLDNLKKRLVTIIEALKYRRCQRKMLNFYSQFIYRGNLCFDVGTHKGSRTEIFLKLGARVIAVEPQESCIKYLRQKFSKEPNFTLLKKGLGDKEGELTLHICKEADTISTFSDKWKTGRFSNYKWDSSELVSVDTLDNLIKQFGLPVFCKIDVEGFEFQVLKGLSRSIPYISFEFTREFFNDTKSCINYLLSLGPVKFNCSLGESMQMLLHTWATPEELYRKLDSIDDDLLWGDIYAKFT